jgi:hypothetical protein
VSRHPFQVVGDDLCPIEPGIIVAHRCSDFINDAGSRGCQKALEREHFDALITLRTILIDAAAPISVPAMLARIPSPAGVGATAWLCGPAMSIGVWCRAG